MRYFVELNHRKVFTKLGKLYPVNETTGNFHDETFFSVNPKYAEGKTSYILELPNEIFY